jgi:DNA-3-methyladenine glycosylase II
MDSTPLLNCPVMAELVARHRPPGYRPRRPFPALVESIVGQQISIKAADSIMAKLRATVPITPAALATADPRRLRRAGLSRAKALYVRELAKFADQGGLRGLSRLEDAQVTERLVTVKGIGVWTTEMFLMFSLGRPDVWPIGDGGIQRALVKLYGARTPKQMMAIGERYRPVRSHAAWYLWRSLGDG